MAGLHLTFDDGPDPRGTPRLLDLLAAADACATFFPIAGRAADQPQLIWRMLEEGHAVGVHCHRHIRHSEQTREQLTADTTLAVDALSELGAEPSLWRTPWGDLAPFSREIANEHGLRIVGWDVDTHDWRGDSAGEMLEGAEPGLEDGAVVLAHDGIGPGARRNTVAETIELVRLIATQAHDRGLRLEALA